MTEYRYRFNFFKNVLPVVSMVTAVATPLLAMRRDRRSQVENITDELTEPEAEHIAERAVIRAEQAEKTVEEIRAMKKGERRSRGGIGRWIVPAVFVLAVRWLMSPPRRAGRRMFAAGTGPAIPRRDQPEMHRPYPGYSERPAGMSTRSNMFDYPSVREETRQATAPRDRASGEADDLKIIEGIGPAIARHLNERGIRTFAQLADTKVGDLEDMLSKAGIRQLSNPITWPEQARLAANGQWDELNRLQQGLKAGRES